VLRSISISYPLPTRGAGMARAACLGCPVASLILVLTYLLAPLLYIGLAYVLLRWQGNHGPLARRWYNRQCMVWEGAAHPLPAAVPAEAVHWFMAPFVTFLPVFLHETRKEVIHRAHKRGIFLKSSARKHALPCRHVAPLS
jgi:hypothetical protein